jgi:predicted RNase H-like HicB family nuclease
VTSFGVIYEQATDGSWSARAADLPVYTVGDTRQEAENEIRAAIALYIEELNRAGEPTPEARSVVGTVSV